MSEFANGVWLFVGAKHENAAWYYKEPLAGAVDLRDHVAFCEYIYSDA